jgi:zinc/manganese transport system substrate-binding protein
MRKTAILLIALLLFAMPAFAKVKVVATLPWIGSVANEIGKGQVEVTTLVKPNQDPHMVEARPSMILATRQADILMYNGLDLEIGYLPVLIESSRNPNIQPGKPGNFDASHFVTVLEKPVSVDRSMGDVHPLGNPHYHYSPARILSVAEGWPRPLCSIRPIPMHTRPTCPFREKVRQKQKGWSSRRRKAGGSSHITSSSSIWPPISDSRSRHTWNPSRGDPAFRLIHQHLIETIRSPAPTAS